jgi:hypothetical protein
MNANANDDTFFCEPCGDECPCGGGCPCGG